MASSQHQFKIGDKAVYPVRGVGEVVAIEEKSIAGHKQEFYVLKIFDMDAKQFVPVEKAEEYGLRPPMSEDDIVEIFDILKEQTIAFDQQTWNRRSRGFMDKIGTGSVFDVAEVIRDLYCLRAVKQLSWGEKKMLKMARDLVVKEIAVARNVPEESVLEDIEALFESNDE
jgi:CarD family transcriptional regulator